MQRLRGKNSSSRYKVHKGKSKQTSIPHQDQTNWGDTYEISL